MYAVTLQDIPLEQILPGTLPHIRLLDYRYLTALKVQHPRGRKTVCAVIAVSAYKQRGTDSWYRAEYLFRHMERGTFHQYEGRHTKMPDRIAVACFHFFTVNNPPHRF